MTENFVVEYVNNTWIIGTNLTTGGNGVKNPLLLTSTLTIPSVIDGHQIEQIGQYAFYQCSVIEEIFLSNSIRVINRYSFGSLENLKTIVIPPSVQIIGYAGIHTYNVSLYRINNTLPNEKFVSHGVLNITFLPHSQIKFIDYAGMSRKENIIVNYFDKGFISCGDIFMSHLHPNVKIYAPYTSRFCNYRTIYQRTCKAKNLLFFPSVITLFEILYS